MAMFKKLMKNIKKLLKNKSGSVKSGGKKKKLTSASKRKKKSPSSKKRAGKKVKKTTRSKSKKTKKTVRKIKSQKVSRSGVPSNYEKVGVITHYFPHVEAGVIKVGKGKISVGDEIHIKGATTNFKQKVNSIQIDHVPVKSAGKGDEAGIQTRSKVRQHDVVYRIK